MLSARKHAEIAARKVWSDVLLRLGLRKWAGETYDEAVIRAFAVSLNEFTPARTEVPLGFTCEHMSITGTGLRSAQCWVGQHPMRPLWRDETNRAAV